MSIERVVTNVETGEAMSLKSALDKSPEEGTRAEKKAKLVQILSRGMAVDRLRVDLPENLYGEWIPNDQAEIQRMELLYFKVDTEHAPKSKLHDTGDGKAVLGDTVFMTCSRETHEILEEIRREEFVKANGPPGETVTTQREEAEYASATDRIGVPMIQESLARVAKKAEIEKALGVDKTTMMGGK